MNQVNKFLYYFISNEKVVAPYGNFSKLGPEIRYTQETMFSFVFDREPQFNYIFRAFVIYLHNIYNR